MAVFVEFHERISVLCRRKEKKRKKKEKKRRPGVMR